MSNHTDQLGDVVRAIDSSCDGLQKILSDHSQALNSTAWYSLISGVTDCRIACVQLATELVNEKKLPREVLVMLIEKLIYNPNPTKAIIKHVLESTETST